MFLKLLVFTILVAASQIDGSDVSADVLGLRALEVNQTVLAKKGGIRDSKCSDRYYSDCFPRRPFLDLNVEFELCHSICQSYHNPGEANSCDWFTYDTQEFNKCQMFSNHLGTIEGFFNTCGVV